MPILANIEEWSVLYTLCFQPGYSYFSDLASVCQQIIRVGFPFCFDLTGKPGHWIGLNSYAGYTQFFAFNQHCSCPTEWIQHALVPANTETLKVVTYQVRRER